MNSSSTLHVDVSRTQQFDVSRTHPTREMDAALAHQVVEIPVAEEMSDSFLAYGLSVITSRAIPDVRDGLKPVQRRILWSMLQMGVKPGTPFRKSARIVGDTMGRYHPHGDSAIYDALVRLGQNFNRRAPLVDPQGNFGSLDNPPAAARYTECRLSKVAMDIVGEVDEDTVDFLSTYDGEGLEPSVLPAAFPNLLVNGASGIAVGMATNMAPHNLGEICAAVELMLSGRQNGVLVDTDELNNKVPGPDFPGGGRVVEQGLHLINANGRGPVRVQAKVLLKNEHASGDAKGGSASGGDAVGSDASGGDTLIVTELPYQVGAEKVVGKVAKLMGDNLLPDVEDIVDLTDTEGLRIHINLKSGARPRAVLADLYRLTSMEETFYVNNVVLVDGVPTTVGLREMCDHYIDHRLQIIVRRTHYRLDKACSRLKILQGLLIALEDIDTTVALIRKARSPADACKALMAHFNLTETQSTHILDMALRRLTSLEREKLVAESEALQRAISEYELILADDNSRLQIVREELRCIVAEHNTLRRSEIIPEAKACDFTSSYEAGDATNAGITDSANDAGAGVGARAAEAVVEAGAGTASNQYVYDKNLCEVTLSTSGYLGVSSVLSPRKKRLGAHDFIEASVISSRDSEIALLTSSGRVFTIQADAIADADSRYRGMAVSSVCDLYDAEYVIACIACASSRGEGALGGDVVCVAANGTVCRFDVETVMSVERGGFLLSLDGANRVVAVSQVAGSADTTDLVIVADNAKASRMPLSDFGVKSLGASTVIGMKLTSDMRVVAAGLVPSRAEKSGFVVLATSAGGLKVTKCDELAVRRRGAKGVFIAKLSSRDKIVAARVVYADTESVADLGLRCVYISDALSTDSPMELPNMGVELPNVGALNVDALNLNMDAFDSLVTVDPTSRYSPPSSTWPHPSLPFERLCESEPIKELEQLEQFERIEPSECLNRIEHPNMRGNVILAPGRW